MKRFSLFMAVTALALTSCSTDDSLAGSSIKNGEIKFKSGVSESNYEALVLGEITDAYILKYGTSAASIEEVMENILSIAKSNSAFMSLEGSDYVFVDEGDINKAIADTEAYVVELPFEVATSVDLRGFITQEADPYIMSDVLVQEFSDEVKNNYNISQTDKEIIVMSSDLTIMSNSKKGRDEDWGTTRDVMACGLSGGLYSPAQAVLNTAVVTVLTM